MLSLLHPFAFLAMLSSASAQSLIDNLSFGHKHSISSDSSRIPGWSILGEGHTPTLMSDKVILTPPYGGGKRGGLWTQAKSQSKDWSVTLEFRAGGVDNGKGNLQFWYIKEGDKTASTSSIYTVGKFDGLAVVIDTNEGVRKIRGFLNDGSVDYHSHNNVDGLAFGHCDYNYRNLGRPSKLEIKSSSGGLGVQIDGKQCFSTTKVSLPAEYNYGVTAASSDPPDSFEVFRFETRDVSSGTGQTIKKDKNDESGQQRVITGTSGIEDLNRRLDELSKTLSSLSEDLTKSVKAQEQRHQELVRGLPAESTIGNLETKISSLDRLLNDLSSELKGGNHKEQFAKIAKQMEETHQSLTQHLPSKMREYVQNHTPRIGFIVFSFMAFQSCCLAVLLWQKYRKSTMPKKFL